MSQAAAEPLRNPVTLTADSGKVKLLGTMHIAEASAVAARSLITQEHEKGSLASVFLELDHSRYCRLIDAESPDESLLSLGLSFMSRPPSSPVAGLVELGLRGMYGSLHKLGFASGVEFKAAIHTARRLYVPIILGDQEIRITMKRLAEGFSDDFKIGKLVNMFAISDSRVSSPMEESIRQAFQAIAQGDVKHGQERLAKLIDRETVQEIVKPFRQFAPNISEAILHERDIVMTDNLINAVRSMPEGKDTIVAIVGLAHVEGISNEWEKRM